jgi:hypothetical protein
VATGALVVVNSSEAISNKLSGIPVIGNVAKVMNMNNFETKDAISQDNNISNTTEDKEKAVSEESIWNTKTTQEEQNAKPQAIKQSVKNDTVYTKKAEAIVESVITENVEVAQEIQAETGEQNEYSLSIARSIEVAGGEGKVYQPEENVDEAYNLPQESNIKASKISDLFEEGYDYKKEISEKIKIQAEERMIINPGIEYNIGDEFTVTGDEEFYINDKNELIIVFAAGVIAAEELGKVQFNIGVIE